IRRYLNPNLQYVVLAGGDSNIPFFRYADPAGLAKESLYIPPVKGGTLSEASIKPEYVLGQDETGAELVLDLGGTRMPVPKLAVGRLVETASEVSATIDAYLVSGAVKTITPGNSLVTGYEFLTDSSDEVANQLRLGPTAAQVDSQLINDTWTADQLRAKLFSATKKDLIYLAGHFDANAALAADLPTTVRTSEVVNSTANFTNTLVFGVGCHAGYNLVDAESVIDPLDWAQAFARKGATLVGGTGFQYGDD